MKAGDGVGHLDTPLRDYSMTDGNVGKTLFQSTRPCFDKLSNPVGRDLIVGDATVVNRHPFRPPGVIESDPPSGRENDPPGVTENDPPRGIFSDPPPGCMVHLRKHCMDSEATWHGN